MQFASEFEWISCRAPALTTMPWRTTRPAGGWIPAATSRDAGKPRPKLFDGLKKVTSTRNVLPVGTDYATQQVGDRDPPRLEHALHLAAVRVCAAKGFFAAVRR